MADCKTCHAARKQADPVPYFAFEGEMARRERTERRLWVVIIILIIALVGTNAGWIWWESQWETVSTTESYEAQAEESGIAIVNRDGEVNYGTSQVHQDDQNP